MAFLTIDDRRIEYRAVPGSAGKHPTLVFLHEGLGSVALWRDFPDKIARRLDTPAVIYSRFGYGQSDGLQGRRTPAFMHEEALDILPRLLDRLGIERPLLVGHSDGASIALVHAGRAKRPVAGVVCLAPHVVVEPIGVESIAKVRDTYVTSDLRERLAKYHDRVDDAFLGWADIWLDPAFLDWSIEDVIGDITAPMLLVQGRDDEYGTLAQIDRIQARANVPISRLVLDACGHSPHRDQEARVVEAIVKFVRAIQK